MREIYLAELRRFRTATAVFALVHLAALAFCLRMIDPLQQKEIFYQLVGATYGLGGLLFGLFQMGSYRRPNLWLQLLHRPLHQRKIGLALMLASATMILIAISLPLLLMVLGQDALTARVVDSRHYLLPLATGLIVLCCYLAAAYIMLAPKRYSASVLMLPLLLLSSAAGGLAALAMQTLVVLWLALAVLDAFKPDLSLVPAHAGGTLLVALPLQLSLYVLLVFASLGYQLAWIVTGTHPLNGTPPVGGYVEATRADSADLLDAGLAGSTAADAELWRQQVRIARGYAIQADVPGYLARHELTNITPTFLVDSENRLLWTFSHDSLKLEGISLVDHKARGSLGIGSEQVPFETPPLSMGNDMLITTDALYSYDSRDQQINRRIQLPAGETLAGMPTAVGQALAVLSDQALYFYEAREFTEGLNSLQPRLRVPLDMAIGSLSRIDLIELLDGYLISLVRGRSSTDGPGLAAQTLIHADATGHTEIVATRALNPDFPLALRYYAWWLSPALSELRSAAVNWLGNPQPLSVREATPTPAAMQGLALALMLWSGLYSIWLGKRQALTPNWRWSWVAICVLTSLPGALSQRLLYRNAERLPQPQALRQEMAMRPAVSGNTR